MARKQNHQWKRVVATKDLTLELAQKNASTMKNDIFIQSCSIAKIDVTKRQASKWNHKKGLAYKSKSM